MLKCWRDLDSCRMPGPVCEGEIPWTAIVEWSRVHGLGTAETRVLADVIRFLDVERLERIASELELKRRK